MPNEFTISVWTEKSEELLKKIETVFQTIDYPLDELPQTVYEYEKPISIVFVGQFSAGKSTIIKA